MQKLAILLSIGIFIFGICFTSAVPQVVFSSINLSINNGTWQISGEGINAQDSFSCGVNYTRENIPITLSRDFQQNDTDVAILINALAQNSNASKQWESCLSEKQQVTNNLTICLSNRIEFSNYTEAKAELANCNINLNTYNSQISDSNKQISDITSQRNILALIAVVLAFFAYRFHQQTKVKTVPSPLKQLPTQQRM